MKPTIGFIGLGLMGAPMAARLMNAGYAMHLYNRTKTKADMFLQRGAHWCESPETLAKTTDVLFTMVTNDIALRELSKKILANLHTHSIHIDCSTVSPSLTAMLEKEYSAAGKVFLHAPVLGGIQQATEGSLLFFVGGNNDAIAKMEPLFMALGESIWKFNRAETASHLKLIMNSFIAGMTSTLAQAISYSEKSGIGGKTVLEVLSRSKLNSASFQSKGNMMLNGEFPPFFFTENLLKDTRLFIEAAQSLNTPVPVAETAQRLLERAVTEGLGKEDYSSIIKIFH